MKWNFGRSDQSKGKASGGNVLAAIVIVIAAVLLAAFGSFLIVFAPILLIFIVIAVAGVAALAVGIWWSRRRGQGDAGLAFHLFMLWLLCINIPTYTRFDQRGIEQIDLINPQSIGRIIVTLLVAFGYVLGGLGAYYKNQNDFARPALRFVWLWPLFALYGWYSFEAVLILRGTDVLLALFRTFEWFLLIALIIRIVNRFSGASHNGDSAGVLAFGIPLAAFPTGLALIMAVTIPQYAFSVAESGAHRLQTPFTHANVLGVLAGMSFFYVLETFRRWRFAFALAALAVVAATYSRGSWIGFVVAFLAWAILKVKPGLPRLVVMMLASVVLITAVVERHAVLDAASVVLSRNSKNPEDVTSASERTVVWHYARQMINESPWLGHGYVVGPKKLGELMANGVSGTYFRARHAHNDLIQAQLSGGVLASLLTLTLYFHLLWLCILLSRGASAGLGRCALTWGILALSYGILTPLLNERLMAPGTIFVFVYCWAVYARKRQLKEMETRPMLRSSAIKPTARSATA